MSRMKDRTQRTFSVAGSLELAGLREKKRRGDEFRRNAFRGECIAPRLPKADVVRADRADRASNRQAASRQRGSLYVAEWALCVQVAPVCSVCTMMMRKPRDGADTRASSSGLCELVRTYRR